MDGHFIDLTPENLAGEHLCCIIRSKKPHPGVEEKRRWLAERLREGHVFRKLDEKGTVFIEYAPLETAWVPVVGDNYLYIYCLWVTGSHKGKGYGRALLESCLADARAKGKSGVWHAGGGEAEGVALRPVLCPEIRLCRGRHRGDRLCAAGPLSGRHPPPLRPCRQQGTIDGQELTIYYDAQCPFIHQCVEKIAAFCEAGGIPLSLVRVDSLAQAKALPCPFNNFAVFYRGQFQTVNLLDEAAVRRLLKK